MCVESRLPREVTGSRYLDRMIGQTDVSEGLFCLLSEPVQKPPFWAGCKLQQGIQKPPSVGPCLKDMEIRGVRMDGSKRIACKNRQTGKADSFDDVS